MSFARIALNALLSLQLLLGLPALAQLAPSSPWKPTNDTDFLNLYQASTATAVNAEIRIVSSNRIGKNAGTVKKPVGLPATMSG